MPALEDAAQLAVAHHDGERTVDGAEQFRLIGADGDRVHALADRPRRTEGRPRQRVAAGDDVVEEHGAQPAALEIQVRLLDALVEDRLHPGRGAHQVERERALERAHALAAQIAEAVHGPVLAARGRHLDAVEGHVEVAALERGDQRLPVVLRELGAHVEAARQRVGDLDLEAREPAPVARVLEDVGLAALHVAAPAERPPRVQPRERIARRRAARGRHHRDQHDAPEPAQSCPL